MIEKGTGMTPWVANPHVIRERRETNEGPIFKWRFCLDYRQQNKLTRQFSYKLPLMSELLRKASSNGRYFISWDLTSYFFQLPLSERSREITSFYLLSWGVFQWTTCPMGMKNSPPLAQMTTDYVVLHMLRILGYIDDFLGYGLTLKQMLETCKSFLMAMSHFGLLVGVKKVNLVRKVINFLGYRVSYQNIHRITPSKLTDLRDIKSPCCKDDLRSILGLLSWYSARAKLRDSTRGMREMCKSGNRFRWGEDMERDLRRSIEILLDPVTGCLRPPVMATAETPMVLFTDSSKYSYGGCLCQVQKVSDHEVETEGVAKDLHRIYLLEYYSKSVPKNQILTPIAILELESLFQCLKHWKVYLHGNVTNIVYVDSRYVSYWQSLEWVSEKIARMVGYIAEFNLEVRFIPSTLNAADVFSRQKN